MSPSNQPWVWLLPEVLLAAQREQLAEHGGGAGVRDTDLFESAIARPRQRVAYADADHADVAAAYAFGLARDHAFVDGNKRIAFLAMELFLLLNGWRLAASDADCVMTMLGVAAGEIGEEALAAWVRANSIEG